MKDKNLVARALANRTRRLVAVGKSGHPGIDQDRIPPFILTALKESLLSGETHYTVRPGMPELRKRIAKEINHLGGPQYDSIDNVLITNGESESLFVALLGLGLRGGKVVVPSYKIRDRLLFEFFDLKPHPALQPLVPAHNLRFVYRERESNPSAQEALVQLAVELDLPDFLNLGETLGTSHIKKFPPVSIQHTLLAGNLNALPGMPVFQTGYLLGPEDLMSRIRVWKQAFSICSAAPSQRAALTALTAWQEKN